MTVTTVPKPDDRALWLKVRHSAFNASDAATLYGRHPFKTLADVTVEKLAPEPIDNGTTAAMERGNRLEPAILAWYSDQLGVDIYTPDVLYQQGSLMATLDGEIVGRPDDWVEAKSTARRWDTAPDYVLDQVTAQAAASGKRTCHIVWIDADMVFKSELYIPTPEAIADVQKRADDVMAFISMGLVPEGLDLDADSITKLYPPEPDKTVDIDDDGLAAVVRWEQARLARIAAEKFEEACKNEVAALLLDAECARYGDDVVATWKRSKDTRRVDWKALAADHKDVVDSYARLVPGARTLRVTKSLGGLDGAE